MTLLIWQTAFPDALRLALTGLLWVHAGHWIARNALVCLPGSPARILASCSHNHDVGGNPNAELELLVQHNDGSLQPLRSGNSARVSPYLTILFSEGWRSRPVYLSRDNCAREAFRRLRVNLRYR